MRKHIIILSVLWILPLLVGSFFLFAQIITRNDMYAMCGFYYLSLCIVFGTIIMPYPIIINNKIKKSKELISKKEYIRFKINIRMYFMNFIIGISYAIIGFMFISEEMKEILNHD